MIAKEGHGANAPHVPIGTLLAGKYRVDGMIGMGGMGVIVRATNVDLGATVAVKVLHPDLRYDEEAFARFLQEARGVGKLKSPHIVQMFDVTSREPEMPFMVMELLDGMDLDAVIQAKGKLSPAFAVELVRQACKGVSVAHAAGILHRDLKPANLFLARTVDGAAAVKVLDFGLMKIKSGAGDDPKITRPNDVFGSPSFMSPEQIAGERLDERSDVWAMGAILFELVTGHTAFGAETVPQTLVNIAVHQPPPMSKFTDGIPEGLEDVVAKCLAKDRADRYQSMTELAGGLAPFREDVDVSSLLSARTSTTVPPLPLVMAPEAEQGPPPADAAGFAEQAPEQNREHTLRTPPPAAPLEEEEWSLDRPKKKKSKMLLIAIATGALLGGLLSLVVLRSGQHAEETAAPTASAPLASPSAPPPPHENAAPDDVPHLSVADLPSARATRPSAPQVRAPSASAPIASAAPSAAPVAASRPVTSVAPEPPSVTPATRPSTDPYPEFGRRK